jgi:hypothetical protein
MCTGLVKKVLASLLTDSGHVAETIKGRPVSISLRGIKRLGRPTHQRLSALLSGRAETDDFSDIILEPLVEHSVCLIEDEVFHAAYEVKLADESADR